jgi:hypothetical protein
MSDDDDLLERAAWVCKRSKMLYREAGQMLRLGPVAGTDRLGAIRDAVGETIDVARHLAEEPRLPRGLRNDFALTAKQLDDIYARMGEIIEGLRAQERDEGDDD